MCNPSIGCKWDSKYKDDRCGDGDGDWKLSPSGQDIVNNVSCRGSKTGVSCFFGRGSLQMTQVMNYGQVTAILSNISPADVGLGDKYGDKIDLLKYPDMVCESPVLAWLTGIAVTKHVCPTDDYILGTNNVPIGDGCSKFCVNGNCETAMGCSDSTNCTGCRFALACVGGGGAGAQAHRQQRYSTFMKNLDKKQ